MACSDDEGNLSNQADGNDRHQGDGNSQSDQTLGKGKFVLVEVRVAALVLTIICLEDRVVDTLMRADLEADVDRVGDQEQDGCDAGDVEDSIGSFLG